MGGKREKALMEDDLDRIWPVVGFHWKNSCSFFKQRTCCHCKSNTASNVMPVEPGEIWNYCGTV